MRQYDDDLNPRGSSVDQEPMSGEERAVDGLLRELGRGPLEAEQDDEPFVQRIIAAIETSNQSKRETAALPAAHGSSRSRINLRSGASQRKKAKPISKRRRSGKSYPWALWISVAAAIVLVFGFILYGTEQSGKLAVLDEITSGCTVVINGKEIVPEKGFNLHGSNTLKVPQGGWALIRYSDGTQVRALAGSVTTFMPSEGDISKKVIINQGSVTAEVAKQLSGEAMVFLTPDIESRVLGTRLSITVSKQAAGKSSRIEVDEGRVRVRQLSDNASVDVSQGQYAMAAPGVKFGVRQMPVEVASGLAGHWKFDEGAGMKFADSSGQGNFGKLVGATWTNGKIGGALGFAGHEYVEISSAGGLNITGELTVSAWIKLSALNRDQKIAGMQDGVSGGYKLSISENNQLDLEIRDAKGAWYRNKIKTGGLTLKNGVWYHVAGVYSNSGNFIKTYVNGELDRVQMTDCVLGATNGTFCVGAEPLTHRDHNFHGNIDDVRVYKRALNDLEIKLLAGNMIR